MLDWSNPILLVSQFLIDLFGITSDFGLAMAIFSSGILVFVILILVAMITYYLVGRLYQIMLER